MSIAVATKLLFSSFSGRKLPAERSSYTSGGQSLTKPTEEEKKGPCSCGKTSS